MTPTPTDDPEATATEIFDRDLEALLLESFARGATVQGSREIESPSSAVPTWRVTIEKIADGKGPDAGAVFLDD